MVLKLTVKFTSLPFQTLWHNWLKFFPSFEKNSVCDGKDKPKCHNIDCKYISSAYEMHYFSNWWFSVTNLCIPAKRVQLVGCAPLKLGRVIPKAWKTIPVACPTSCSALMGGCKGTVHVRCCHGLANQCSIHFKNTRVAHGASKRRWAPQTTRETPNGVQKPCVNETERNFEKCPKAHGASKRRWAPQTTPDTLE